MLRSPLVRVLIGIVGIFLFYLLGVAVRHSYGDRVEVRNTGTETIRNLSFKLQDGDKTLDVPVLSPGARTSVYLAPREKSNIVMTINDGRKQRDITVFSNAMPGACALTNVTILSSHNTTSYQHNQSTCWRGWLDFMS